MRRRQASTPRRGYAVMLVFVFLILLLSVLGTTFRQLASVLRVEAARSRQIVRDEGSVQAAAKALTMLGNGPPPTDPYVVAVGVTTSAGARSYQITIASDPAATGQWTVYVIPAPSAP